METTHVFSTTEVDDVTDVPELPDLASSGVHRAVVLPLVGVIVVTVGANVVVIASIGSERKMWKPINFYVVSLAMADMLVGLIVMSLMAVYTTYGLWPYSDGLCTAWMCIDFGLVTVSMLHFCLIAHDRYRAIHQPLRYNDATRTRYVITYIIVCWVGGLLLWHPSIVYFRSVMAPVPYDCILFPPRNFIVAQTVVVYYVPIIGMVFVYIACLRGLRQRFRKLRSSHTGQHVSSVSRTLSVQAEGASYMDNFSVDASMTATASTSQFPVDQNQTRDGQAAKTRKRKTKAEKRHAEHARSLRVLGVVMGMFLFCHTPFCFIWPIAAYCDNCVPARLYEYSYWSVYLNSTVNPVLYFICNSEFRMAFRKFIKKLSDLLRLKR